MKFKTTLTKTNPKSRLPLKTIDVSFEAENLAHAIIIAAHIKERITDGMHEEFTIINTESIFE
jgi:hypothetical protein